MPSRAPVSPGMLDQVSEWLGVALAAGWGPERPLSKRIPKARA
jgi:hypothetical protein